MRILKNSLIKASAGTGKTFALATRMIRLMLLGVEPSHIVALTFSRAAAGEIFNRIAGRLADAATTDAQSAVESAHLFQDLDTALTATLRARYGASVSRAVFTSLLRKLIATQHASMIGTIDSFMTRMIQAFPLELGLQGSLAIMEPYRAEREKNAAMTVLLNRVASTPEAELFFEAFRQATFGKEGKSYGEKLAKFVATWHEILHDYQEAKAWGRPEVIWPGGVPFAIHDTPEHLAQRLAAEVRDDWQQAGREKPWDEFCDFVRTFNTTFPAKASIQNVLNAYRPQSASVEISYNRKRICFTGEKARLILQTVETLYGLVLRARCQSTQGIYRLMTQIESIYAQNTRNRGLLTFDDIPRLIASLATSVRQNIEYRFDGRFRHWALDEFQDTSHAQWAAVSNLVDEVIQSDEDERSLFIVGDMKQAIYGWRGGDVAIFEKEADSGHYAMSDLNTTYRYCPQIADLVNRVFDGDKIETLLTPGAQTAGQKWKHLWALHTSQQRDGFVQVERVPSPDKDADEKPIDPYLKAACEHLLHVRPWERRLSAAVLVRSNEHGKRFADALRRVGIPTVWEGESAICDTPVVTALLHVLQVAEHPGNTLAWHHVCATPLARTVFRHACALSPDEGAAALSQQVLDDVSRLGLPRALRFYIDALSGVGSDLFTQTRLDELIRAATQFTLLGDASATLTDFITFVEAFITRDVADTSTVKILTIHRSKGLGFDFVLLPIIEATGMDAIRSGEVLYAGDSSWLLTNPGKQIVQSDPVLATARESNMNDGVFEALCVFYVAMTRAKRALVMLLKPAAESATESCYFSNHIETALGVPLPWSQGDPAWFEHTPPSTEVSDTVVAPAIPVARLKRRVIRRMTPSSAAYHGRVASELFSARDDLASQHGTRLHDALSKIAWLDETTPQPADILKTDLDLTVVSAFRDALAQPPHMIDLWRERSFELVTDDQWLSGTFDRVVFFEAKGQRRAEIYDYKSNRRRDGESEAAFAQRMRDTYEGQMTAYRHALSRLSGLDETAIRCVLLLTATCQAVPVLG
ncbi:MAG: UvrD-helicase domain-containing protein [bacterium]